MRQEVFLPHILKYEVGFVILVLQRMYKKTDNIHLNSLTFISIFLYMHINVILTNFLINTTL